MYMGSWWSAEELHTEIDNLDNDIKLVVDMHTDKFKKIDQNEINEAIKKRREQISPSR